MGPTRIGQVRPLRRFVYLLMAWTCLCYGLFQLNWPRGSPQSTSYVLANGDGGPNVNTRLLLQKVTETPVSSSPVASPSSAPSSSSSSPASSSSSTGATSTTSASKILSLEDELTPLIQQRIPNVPFELWMKEKSRVYVKNHTCAFYPNVFDIKFNNNYWQTFATSNGTFYLYGAYYDDRVAASSGAGTIRILAMIDRIAPTVKTHCLLWFDASQDPVVTPVVEYKYIWNKKWGNYKQGLLQPYLISCLLPPANSNRRGAGQVPISVSMTEKGCQPATNNLRVNNNRPAKRGQFAVCVKGLDFWREDLSVRLVEWIELLTLLGADKIFLYQLEVHPNISKVLQYYQQTGRIELTPITLPGEQPNIPGLRHLYLKSKVTSKRQNEVIPYNDCLYRNLYSYDYIALMDTDEVILPRNVQSWAELMDSILIKDTNSSHRASFNFRNVYFWDEHQNSPAGLGSSSSLAPGSAHEATRWWYPSIPRHMHMLQHVYRSANYTKPNQYVKCFHRVSKILTLHNHFPLACLGGAPCSSYPVEPEMAHLQHYRADCVSTLKKSCDAEYKQHLVKDTIVWRYKDQLIPRVDHVLTQLGLI